MGTGPADFATLNALATPESDHLITVDETNCLAAFWHPLIRAAVDSDLDEIRAYAGVVADPTAIG